VLRCLLPATCTDHKEYLKMLKYSVKLAWLRVGDQLCYKATPRPMTYRKPADSIDFKQEATALLLSSFPSDSKSAGAPLIWKTSETSMTHHRCSR